MLDKFRGTGVALVTPFNEDGSIDYNGLKNLLQTTADKGVNYYVVQGTTGESATTTSQEKTDLLKYVKGNNPKSLPIVYGIGGNNTQAIIDTIKSTDLEGVDAVLSASPYYNKPSQEGIYQHYVALAEASPIPIILYNVPGRTASNITPDTTLRLAQHKNIIGTKEASGSIAQAMDIIKNKPEDFFFTSGDDMLTVPLYAIGSIGVISVMANGLADIFNNIYNAVTNKDFAVAAQEAFRMIEMNSLMYLESNPVGIKQLLKEQGVCKSHVRLPLVDASEDLQQKIKEACQRI
ncbi:MAG: 4-hydroxy-tetrahydrodipicolinate synthase [Bacteroidota bacterium]